MRFCLALMLALSVSGCGTMANLGGMRYAFISLPGEMPVRAYGGVRNDVRWVTEGVGVPDEAAGAIDDPVEFAFGLPVFGYFAVVDPVLSFVGDTVTLPLVFKAQRESSREATTVVTQSR